MNKKPSKPIIRVFRNPYDGKIRSELTTKPYDFGGAIVIDWQGHSLRPDTIRMRAKSIAERLGLPYEEDFTWRCIANRKLKCKCPECIKNGTVV